MMQGKKQVGRILFAVRSYVIFFMLAGFCITCCMMLFLTSMMGEMGLELTPPDIRHAARITFFNVLLLTGVFTLMDSVRRHYLIDKPVQRILHAAERLMQGDFSVRIAPVQTLGSHNGLDEIAACFNRMAQELSGTETLRTDFISNVSHELKTPLSVIRNYATMLEEPDLPHDRRMAYAKVIGDTSRQLAGLISNILRLSKLENQQIFPAFTTFDLSEQLCACLLAFEDAWEDKALDIETAIEDGVQACGDAELLSLVWNNLFSNAVKFTDCGGRISVTLTQEEGQAIVTVADTGCGFGSEVGAHIFEKFYQGDPSHATQGSGLGLALVRRVVDIHGGEIAVSSAPGRGSTFTVRIKQEGAWS